MAELFGKAVTNDPAAAAQVSPLYRVDSLDPRTRLMLATGERDPRVPPERAEAFAAAVRARGLAGTHLQYAREGLSISREPNVLHLWHAVERFLCEALQLPPPRPLDESLTSGHTCEVMWDGAKEKGRARRPGRSPARR